MTLAEVNNEHVLAEAVLVQVGQGVVVKHQGQSAIALDDLDVCIAKFLVCRDELSCKWDDFVAAPIKCIVGTFPLLKRCYKEECLCDSWHNPDGLSIREPLLDVWRRQYFQTEFPISGLANLMKLSFSQCACASHISAGATP